MKFLKTSAWASISTAISLVTRLITNKIVAVYLGTSGMFVLGQLRDFLKVANVIGHVGTTNGTTKYVAEYKEHTESQDDYLGTGFRIHLVASLIVSLICILFNNRLSELLFNTSEFSKALVFISISLVTISIHTFVLAVLNGLKKVRTYVLITSVGAIVSAVILVLLVLKFKLIGALYAVAINQIILLIISLMVIKYFSDTRLTIFKFRFNKIAFKNLSKFSLMSLVAPFCLVSATLFVRNFLSDEYGSNYAGSWEGMWRLSAMYLLFITTTFKFYLLPTYSQLEGKALRKEVFNTWKYVFPLMIVLTLSIYLLRDFIVNLLFSEEFLLIGMLIGFHLLGDIVKMNTWVIGNILIAKAKIKAFIFFQVEWATVFILGTIFFSNKFGFKGVAIAYFVACTIHFLLMNIYLRKLLWSKTTVTYQN